jgi:hypothetical protein
MPPVWQRDIQTKSTNLGRRMLYLASSQGSADSADSGEVTPSLAQTCTKHPQISSYKGEITSNTQLPRKPADVVACVHSLKRPGPKLHAVSLSLFAIDFSTRYAQVI